MRINKSMMIGILIVIIGVTIFEFWAEVINNVRSNYVGFLGMIMTLVGFAVLGFGAGKVWNNGGEE